MVQMIDLQERMKMRFLTVDYAGKSEGYADHTYDVGTIAKDILNIPDYILEELHKLTEPMMNLVGFWYSNEKPKASILPLMLTASQNMFRVVDLLRDVPPFCYQDFTWLDGKLQELFAAEKVQKWYKKKDQDAEVLFIWLLCLVSQLGFCIRDFQKSLTPLIQAMDNAEVSRNPAGFAQQFDFFFHSDAEWEKQWMSFSNISVEYLPNEKGLVRRMHYASFPSMFRSNLYEALAVGNAPKRCPICNKFFLTTNARRQIYCDGYAPEEYGEMTCRQVGNRLGRAERERAQNNPVRVLYRQVVNAIDQRVSRGTLDKTIAEKAKALARDKQNMAITWLDYANGDYKTDMTPDALIAEVTWK